MGKVDYYLNTYRYFKFFHSEIDSGNVLDYGSNYGMFLDSSKGQFSQNQYIGLDVDNDAVAAGRQKFPEAKFIWYNGHNLMYNPMGTNERPEISQKFDTIISYSVLTHTTIEDTISTIDWLYDKLNPGGRMLLSWLSIENKTAVNFFYNKRVRDFGSCEKIVADDYVYLNENKISKSPKDGLLLIFYHKNYLSQLLSNYNHKLVSPPAITPDCFQDCIIIQK